MSESQNNVKVLPRWSAISTRHIYPVNRKDHYHPKVVEQDGWGGGGRGEGGGGRGGGGRGRTV